MNRKDETKRNLRDFGIGMAGGAASAVVAVPFNKLTDPISASNYHTALKKSIPKSEFPSIPEKLKPKFKSVGDKMIYDRPFLKYVSDQLKTTLWKDPYTQKTTREFITLPLDMTKKGIGFGATALVAGALYRHFKDTQPIEKQGALKATALLFLSCKSKNF
jgi:hypothetical protein